MPTHEPDKVQREIEELLDKLDSFVPEERLVSKIRKRRKDETGPNLVERTWKRASRISLGHVLLTGLALLLIATFFRAPLGAAAGPVMIAGIVLAAGAFLFSIINGDSRRTIGGGRPEKRWRGQVIDYSEPSAASRLKDWFRRRRR
jgi:hypothetical protein